MNTNHTDEIRHRFDHTSSIGDDIFKKIPVSQPSSRKSRSISRYFLGVKRGSVDENTQDNDISRCLAAAGVLDSCDLWASVTLFRDYNACRRIFVLTAKQELLVGKCNSRQSLFKLKQRIELNRTWISTHLQNTNDGSPTTTALEIASLTYYDCHRSLAIGWPIAENFIVEFDSKTTRDIWQERIELALHRFWQVNSSNIEHVRVVIDRSYEYDHNNNNNTASFLIRKVIGIRPQETVRDIIKKCIDAFHLRDPSVDNYVLFVTNNSNATSLVSLSTPPTTSSNLTTVTTSSNTSLQSTQTTHSQCVPLIGHEYPYAIKMKHLKSSAVTAASQSFDGDDHISLQSGASMATMFSHHNISTASLNNVTTTYHDFELRKRDTLADSQTKKHRFFPKRKTKDPYPKQSTQQQLIDEYLSSSTPHLGSTTPSRSKTSSTLFFGQTLDELVTRHNNQLPPVIMHLLEILYAKGPETTGIFRKVANTRSVKECIDKIERNIPIQEEDLHPILAAGIFKHFLRTLPEPVFNSIQYDTWKKCLRLSTSAEKISFARKNILTTLSNANYILLKAFICILQRIAHNVDSNGMNPFNLGLCVSNSLFKTESTTITSGKQEADVMSSIVEFLIQNCSILFGSDVITCVPDKHIIVHSIANLVRPTASSMESLDEVESSPHLPVVNRSRDSGLAASDQPFNDDSSEVSEHVRRNTAAAAVPPFLPVSFSSPDWSSSISCGTGIVLTSIINNPILGTTTTLSVARRRSSKYSYKPSKQFMEREKLTKVNLSTSDESDNASSSKPNEQIGGDSSVRSSTTTVNNTIISTGCKLKRSKSLSRHSSLGSGEQHHQQQKQQQQNSISKESRRISTNDVKRTSSLKQFHHSTDDDENENNDEDDDEKNTTLLNEMNNKKKLILPTTRKTSSEELTEGILHERRTRLIKAKMNAVSKASDDDDQQETMTTRSIQLEPQQDLDLISEPLSSINQRLISTLPQAQQQPISTPSRSASFTIVTTKRPDSSSIPQSPVPLPSAPILLHSDRSRQPTTTTTTTDGRSRHNGPLAATTNQIYVLTQTASRYPHLGQINPSTQPPIKATSFDSQSRSTTTHTTTNGRIFVHNADSRPFVLGKPVQMKPIDDFVSNGRRRPCHRQNALRYKSIDQQNPKDEHRPRTSTPAMTNNRIYCSDTPTNISRYQSIERRVTPPPPPPPSSSKGASFDINDELRLCDISWSVREKAKLFEHKLSTGRENYV